MYMMRVLHKRTNTSNNIPSPSSLNYGEIAINYKMGEERIFIKNDNNDIVIFSPLTSINKPLITFSENSITIKPNIYYRKTNLSSSLTIYLNTDVDENTINEYFIEFTTSATGTTISLPNTIKWYNGELPTFEPNTTYQLSIINNLGICMKFK